MNRKDCHHTYAITFARRVRGGLLCLDIRQAVSAVTLACFLLSSVPVQGIAAVVNDRQAARRLCAIADDSIVPGTAGKVTDAWYAGPGKLVINIQDLHCHPEVQKNIVDILASLDQKYRLRKIYQEGAAGKVDTSWLEAIEDKTLRKKIVDGMIGKGKLTAAEYYAVTSGKPDIIEGLEDETVFRDNILRLNSIITKQDEIRDILKELKITLSPLQNTYCCSQNLRVERIVNKYRKGNYDTRKYYCFLEKYAFKTGIDINSYRNLTGYLSLIALERKLDYGSVSHELQQFLLGLKQRIPYNAYRSLIEKTGNFSRLDELAGCLPALTAEYGCTEDIARDFPHLQDYVAYIAASKKINPSDLVLEEKRLVREIRDRVSLNQSEREVVFILDFARLLDDYFANAISADDYAYFSRYFDQFKLLCRKYGAGEKIVELEPYFGVVSAYYSANLERNNCFLQSLYGNALGDERQPDNAAGTSDAERILAALNGNEEGVVVTVTGGFHTRGFTQLLKDHNISYLVITPRVTGDTKYSETVYTELIQEQGRILSQSMPPAVESSRLIPVEDKVAELGRQVLETEMPSRQFTVAETEKLLNTFMKGWESAYAKKTGKTADLRFRILQIGKKGECTYAIENVGGKNEFRRTYQFRKNKEIWNTIKKGNRQPNPEDKAKHALPALAAFLRDESPRGRLLHRAEKKPAHMPPGTGISQYLHFHPDRAVKFLPTIKIAEGDLPYASGLRPVRQFTPLPARFDDIVQVPVRMPLTDVLLVSMVHNGSQSVVRLGFLEDGRPVALKMCDVQQWYGADQPDDHSRAACKATLEEYCGAKIADDLGIGPVVHGVFFDGDGKYNIVMDIVPGDWPRHPFASGLVTPETFRDLREIRKRLIEHGMDYGFDFQYFVTALPGQDGKAGHVQLIDQKNSIYVPGSSSPLIDPATSIIGATTHLRKYVFLLIETDPEVRYHVLQEMKMDAPEVFLEIRKYLEKNHEGNAFRDLKALCDDIERGQALGKNIEGVVRIAIQTIAVRLEEAASGLTASGEGLVRLLALLQNEAIALGEKYYYLLGGAEGEQFLPDAEVEDRFGDSLPYVRGAFESLGFDVTAIDVKVSSQDKDLMMPESKAYGLGTFIVSPLTQRLTFVMHESIFEYLDLRGPPDGVAREAFAGIFAEHEGYEYRALNDPSSSVYRLFGEYLASEMPLTSPVKVRSEIARFRTGENFHRYIAYLAALPAEELKKRPSLEQKIARQEPLLEYARQAAQMEELVRLFKIAHPGKDPDIIRKAAALAFAKHKNKQFPSGKRYAEHCLDVAYRVAAWGADGETIAAALLHKFSTSELREVLPKRKARNKGFKKGEMNAIVDMVERLTRISKLAYVDGDKIDSMRGIYTLQNYMNMLVKLAQDDQTMLLAFADRLLTVPRSGSERERHYRYQEIQHVYVPLAMRLDADDIAEDLRNEAFRLSQPDAFEKAKAEVERFMGMTYEDAEKYLEELKEEIADELKKMGVPSPVIKFRVKTPFSIWEKLNSDRRAEYTQLQSLKDIMGLHIIVDEKFLPEVMEYLSLWVAAQAKAGNVSGAGAKGVYMKAAEKGFSRIKYNFEDAGGRRFEVCLFNSQDYVKFQSGYIDETALRSPMPHWIYKIGTSVKEENGVFIQELEFEPQGNHEQAFKTRQSFVTDNLRYTGIFKQDFNLLYSSLRDKEYIAFLHEGGKKGMSVLALPEGAVPADLAAKLEIDRLNTDYAGVSKVYMVKHGERSLDEERPRQHMNETTALTTGDGVTLITGKPPLVFPNVPIVRHAKTPRAMLLASDIKNRRTLIDNEKKSIAKHFGNITGLPDKLKSFAQSKGLKDTDELYLSLALSIIDKDQIGRYLQSVSRKVIEVSATDRVALLRDIAAVFAAHELNIVEHVADITDKMVTYKFTVEETGSAKSFTNAELKAELQRIDNVGKVSVRNIKPLFLQLQSLGENVDALLEASGIEYMQKASATMAELLIATFERGILDAAGGEYRHYADILGSELAARLGIDVARVSVKVSAEPLLIQHDAWALATLGANSVVAGDSKTPAIGDVVIYVHEEFLEGLKNKAPPEQERLLKALSSHEAYEFLALNDIGPAGEQFTRFLIDELHLGSKESRSPAHRTSRNFHSYLDYLAHTANMPDAFASLDRAAQQELSSYARFIAQGAVRQSSAAAAKNRRLTLADRKTPPQWAKGLRIYYAFLRDIARPGQAPGRFGTFADLKYTITHVKQMGFNALFLMPLAESAAIDKSIDDSPYSMLSPYALDPRYIDWAATGLKGDTLAERWQHFSRDIPADFAAMAQEPRMVQYAHVKALRALKYRSARIQEYPEIEGMYGNFERFAALPDEDFRDLHSRVTESDEYRLLYHLALMEQYFARKQLSDAVAFAHAQGVSIGFDQPFFRAMEGVDALFTPEMFARRGDGKIYPAGWNIGQEGGQLWGNIETQRGLASYDWEALKRDGYGVIVDPIKFMIEELGFDFVRGDALHFGFGREGLFENIAQVCRENGALFIPETLGCQDEKLVDGTCRTMGMLPIETMSGPGQGWKWAAGREERWKQLFNYVYARSFEGGLWNPVHHDSEIIAKEYEGLFDAGTPMEVRSRVLYVLSGLMLPDYSLLYGDEYGRETRVNLPGTSHAWKQPSIYANKKYDITDTIRKINAARDEYPCFAEYGNLRDWSVTASRVSFVRSSSGGKGVRVSIDLTTGEFTCRDISKSVIPNNVALDALLRRLDGAAGQFLYDDPALGGWTVVAGSPHFDQRNGAALSNWGRDTMIALPGLCLPGKRYDIFKAVILNYLRFVKDGLLPNFVGDGKAPSYNSSDASLWLFWAVGEYLKTTGDYAFLDTAVDRGGVSITVMQLLEEIAGSYRNGVRIAGDAWIGMDSDFLIAAGNAGTQLTWMDAKPDGGQPVTSRYGKAVEVNALWYNALRVMAAAYERRGNKKSGDYTALAENVKTNFAKFWNEDAQCLFDTIDGDEAQGSKVRPNQVFAVALGLLDKEHARLVLEKVGAELLTPYGLRTLSPADKDYHAQHLNELSYHQGTVWPWLMGGYITACDHVYGRKKTLEVLAKNDCFGALAGFISELGSVPEIVNGECKSIYHWNTLGCKSQAWSVGAPLYALFLMQEEEKQTAAAMSAALGTAGAVLSAANPVSDALTEDISRPVIEGIQHFRALMLEGERKKFSVEDARRERSADKGWAPVPGIGDERVRTVFEMPVSDCSEIAAAVCGGSRDTVGALIEEAVAALQPEYRNNILGRNIRISLIGEDASEYLFEDHREDGYIGVNRLFITMARTASDREKAILRNIFVMGIAHELRHEGGMFGEYIVPDIQLLTRLMTEQKITLDEIGAFSDVFVAHFETAELFRLIRHEMTKLALEPVRIAAAAEKPLADAAAEQKETSSMTATVLKLSGMAVEKLNKVFLSRFKETVRVEFELPGTYKEQIEQSARLLLPYSRLLAAVNILLRHDEMARFKKIAFDFYADMDAVRAEGDTLHFYFKYPESLSTADALKLFRKGLGWDFSGAIEKLGYSAPHLLLSAYDFDTINVILHERMAGMGDLVFIVNTGQAMRQMFPDKKIRLIFHSDADVRLIAETKLFKGVDPEAAIQKIDGMEIINTYRYAGDGGDARNSWLRATDDLIGKKDISIIYALGVDEKAVSQKQQFYSDCCGKAAGKIYIHELGFECPFQNPLKNGDAYIGLGEDKVGMAPVSPISKEIYSKKYPRESARIRAERERILKKMPGWEILDTVLHQTHLDRTVASEWGFLYAHTGQSVKKYFGVFEAARTADAKFAGGDKTFFMMCGRSDTGVHQQIRELAEQNDYNLFVYDDKAGALELARQSKENKVTIIMDYSVPRKLFGELFLYSDDLPTMVSGQDNLANIIYMNQLSSGRPFFWETLIFQGDASFNFNRFVEKTLGKDAYTRLRGLWEIYRPEQYADAAAMFYAPHDYRVFFKQIATAIEQHNSFMPQMYYLMLQMFGKSYGAPRAEETAGQLIEALAQESDARGNALGINVSAVIDEIRGMNPLLARFLARPSKTIAQALVDEGVFAWDEYSIVSSMINETLRAALYARSGELGFSADDTIDTGVVTMTPHELVAGRGGCIVAAFGIETAPAAEQKVHKAVFGQHRALNEYLSGCVRNNSPPPRYENMSECVQELVDHEIDEFLALNADPASSVVARLFSEYLKRQYPAVSDANLPSLKTSDNFHAYINSLARSLGNGSVQLNADEQRIVRQERLLALAKSIMRREEYKDIVSALIEDPVAGDIFGTAGLRKRNAGARRRISAEELEKLFFLHARERAAINSIRAIIRQFASGSIAAGDIAGNLAQVRTQLATLKNDCGLRTGYYQTIYEPLAGDFLTGLAARYCPGTDNRALLKMLLLKTKSGMSLITYLDRTGTLIANQNNDASHTLVRGLFRGYFAGRTISEDAVAVLASAVENDQIRAEALSRYFMRASEKGLYANGMEIKDSIALLSELGGRSLVEKTYTALLETRSERRSRGDTAFNLPPQWCVELEDILFDYYRNSGGIGEFKQLLWNVEKGVISLEKLLIDYAAAHQVPYDYLITEIQRQLSDAEDAKLPHYSVISDIHGSYYRFVSLISHMLGREFDPGKTLAEQGVTKESVAQGTAGIHAYINDIFILGDLLDRGPEGMKTFRLSKELIDTGLGKYVTGNHDLYAFMNLLGLHLPWYTGYKGISPDYRGYGIDDYDGKVMSLLEAKRAANPAVVNDINHWAEKLSEYMAYASARQKGEWKGLESKFNAIFTEMYGYDLAVTDVINNPEGVFASDEGLRKWWGAVMGRNVGIQVYTGVRGTGKMSLNWWLDRRDEMETLRVRDGQNHAAQWQMLADDIDGIISAQKEKMSAELGGGNWEWAVIDAIMYRNYESAEWWALDWVYHKGWGSLDGGLLSEINRDKNAVGAASGELLNNANYLRYPELQALRDFYMKNFCLYRNDRYGNVYMHGFLPADEEGDICIGRIDRNGMLERFEKNGKPIKGFYYKGKHYRGKGIFKGFDLIAADINGFAFGETSLSEIYEALALVNSLYSDLSTQIKPDDLKRYKQFGFNKILDKLGVNRLFTGHNPVSKLKKTGIDMVENDDVTGKVRLVNVDGEMSHEYVKPNGRGSYLNIGPRGIMMTQYESGASDAQLQDETLIPGDEFLKYVLNELILNKAKAKNTPTALGYGVERLLNAVDPLLGQFIVKPTLALAEKVMGNGYAAAMPADAQQVLRPALEAMIQANREAFGIASADTVQIKLVALTSDDLVRDKDAFLLGTMGFEKHQDAATGKVSHTLILSAHQILLDAAKNHGPPAQEFLVRLAEHEVDEYLAIHRPTSEIGALFTAYLTGVLGIPADQLAAAHNSKNFHAFIFHLNKLPADEKAARTALEQRLAGQAPLIELAHALQGIAGNPDARAANVAHYAAAMAKLLSGEESAGLQDWEKDYYRLADTYLEKERTREIFHTADEFYKHLDIDAYREKVRAVGKVMEKAPMICEVRGLGFPFYGNAEIRRRIYRTLRAVRDGTRREEDFAERLIPDVDLLLVYGGSDEGPWSLREGVEIDGDLKDRFVQQTVYYLRQWKKVFAELSQLKIINKLGGYDYDPVREFIDNDRLNLDIVPIPQHVWQNMPVFVDENDQKIFKFIRDLLYTSEPMSPLDPDKDVVLQFRRNYALQQIATSPVPFTEEGLLAHLREQHVYRHLLELFEETRAAFDARHRAALHDGMDKGLITTGTDGNLMLTPKGRKFLETVMKMRQEIIKEGYMGRDVEIIVPYTKLEKKFLADAQAAAESETAAETARVAAKKKEGERGLYSAVKENYLRMIREAIRKRSDARTMLYIGSAGDISTALACTDASLFIFVDCLPFVRMDTDEGDNEARDVYIKEKVAQGWSRSETLDVDVKCARSPIVWELEALGVSRDEIRISEVNGIPEVRFTLPGEHVERTIVYYRIDSAYDTASYPDTLQERVSAGIDVCMTKAFHRIAIPPVITDFVVNSLNPGGVILTDDNNQWMADNAGRLTDVTNPDIRRYEQDHKVTFGYDTVNVFARSDRNNAKDALRVVTGAPRQGERVVMYRNQLKLPVSLYCRQFVNIHVGENGTITVYDTQESFANAILAADDLAEPQRKRIAFDTGYEWVDEQGIVQVKGRFREKLMEQFNTEKQLLFTPVKQNGSLELIPVIPSRNMRHLTIVPAQSAVQAAVETAALARGMIPAGIAEKAVDDPVSWIHENAEELYGSTIVAYRPSLRGEDIDENSRLNTMGMNAIIVLPYQPHSNFTKVGAVTVFRNGQPDTLDVLAGTINGEDGAVARALCVEGLLPQETGDIASWIEKTPVLHGEIARLLKLPFEKLQPKLADIAGIDAANSGTAWKNYGGSLLAGTAFVYRNYGISNSDPALKQLAPFIDCIFSENDFPALDTCAGIGELIMKVYEPSVLRKNAVSVARPGAIWGENIMVSALRGNDSAKDPGIGELKDIEQYFDRRLKEAGANLLPLLPLTRPCADSPFNAVDALAGDEALIDVLDVDEVRRLDVKPAALFAGEAELKEVDRAAVYERKFGILSKAYNLLEGERLKEFEAYAGREAAWLNAYADRMAAARLLGISPAAVDDGAIARVRLEGKNKFSAYTAVYKYMQWLFAQQLSNAVARVHEQGGKVQFWMDIDRNNRTVADAIRHWFGFGFDGVRLNIKDDGSASDEALAMLHDAIDACKPDALVTVKLPGGTPVARGEAIRGKFDYMRIREYDEVRPGEGVTGNDIIEMDPVDAEFRPHVRPGTAAGDARKFYDDCIEKLEGAAGILFTIGNAWGDDRTLMSRDESGRPLWNYRMPSDGEVNERRVKSDFMDFTRAVAARMRGQRQTKESFYNRGYQIGLTIFQGVQLGEKERALLAVPRQCEVYDAKGAVRAVIQGYGLYCLQSVAGYLSGEGKQGEESLRYHAATKTALFSRTLYPLIGELAKVSGANRKYWEAVLSHITYIDQQAAWTDDTDMKVRCYEELFGMLRGISESVAESRYLSETTASLPDTVTDRSILRALLSLYDSFGKEYRAETMGDGIPQQVKELCRPGNVLAGFAALASTDGLQSQEQAARSAFSRLPAEEKTLLPTVLYARTLLALRRQQDKTEPEIDAEIREVVNPLMAAFMKRGIMPGMDFSAAGGKDAAGYAWATSELLRIFDAIADQRVPELPEKTKEMFQLFNTSVIHAIKAAG